MNTNDATTYIDDDLEQLIDSIETVRPSEPDGVLLFREPELTSFLDAAFDGLC